MARTHTTPGPKPRYGDRQEIHVLIPTADLRYIRSVADNLTEWVIAAIREKRTREERQQSQQRRQQQQKQQEGEATP